MNLRSLKFALFLLLFLFTGCLQILLAQDQGNSEQLILELKSEALTDLDRLVIYEELVENLTDSSLFVTYQNQFEQLAIKSANDTMLFKAYWQKILFLNRQAKYDESISTLDSLMLPLTRKLNSLSREGQVLDQIGLVQYFKGEMTEAARYDSMALEVLQEAGNLSLLANSYSRLYSYLQRLGFDSLGLINLQKAKAIYESTNDLAGRARIYRYEAAYLYRQNDIPRSQDKMLQALSLFEQVENKAAIASIYNNLGVLNSGMAQYDRSLAFHLKSLAIKRELGNIRDILFSLENAGTSSFNGGNYLDAIKYHEEGLELSEKNGLDTWQSFFTGHLARTYVDMDSIDQAAKFSALQEKLIEKLGEGFSYDKQNAFYIKGWVLQNQGQFREAMAIYQDLLSERPETDLMNLNLHKRMYECYQELGDHKKAFEFSMKAAGIQDSIYNDETKENIIQTNLAHEFDKEKQQIQAENEKNLLIRDQELQRQRLMIIIGAVLVIAMTMIGYLLARFRIRSKAQETEKLKEIGQFKEAMTGMIAHDLKNPLGVIMGTESEKPSTRNMARQMLSLVNNMLDVQKFEKAEVKLQLEGVAVERLILEAVDQVRPLLDEKNISINYKLEESVAVEADRELLMRVVINLLTNAIKYSPANSEITAAAKESNQHVLISMADQGQGIPKDQLDSIFGAYQQLDPRHSGMVGSTGLGLTFCKLALQAHGSEIRVDSEIGKGTRFSFELSSTEIDFEKADDKEEKAFRLTEEERAAIISLLPSLRNYRMHQAMQMETLLEPVRNTSDSTERWVEAVLNAAYNGNEEHFKELVAGVETEA